jgi:hypothetical protein
MPLGEEESQQIGDSTLEMEFFTSALAVKARKPE